MPFNWRGLLIFTEDLLQDYSDTREEVNRSIVNRAYFSAHNLAKPFVKYWCDTSVRRGSNSHQDTINGLKNSSKGYDIKSAGRKLSRLRDNRKTSDYESNTNVDRDMAEDSVEWAQDVIDALDSWNPDYGE